MNILFITIAYPSSERERNLYTDLMDEFSENGHSVYVACTLEKRLKQETRCERRDNISVLRIKCGNITQNKNLFQKGIALISLENKINKAINSHFSGIKFNLILYSTPPITFLNIIQRIKKRDNALSYLLLKDIFPQNAVDIGLMSKWSPIAIYFKRMEKKLYKVSDFIGCMSQANVRYLSENNPSIPTYRIEECPNSIKIRETTKLSEADWKFARRKIGIQNDQLLILYGGNLGKPQGIDFLIRLLDSNSNNKNIFFLIIGNGSEYSRLLKRIEILASENIRLISRLPEEEYSEMVQICDIGMILLDHRFTIPNFPSRLLSYLHASKPVLAATDKSSDVGMIIESYNCGYNILSEDVSAFNEKIRTILEDRNKLHEMGSNAHSLLRDKYDVRRSYNIIMQHFEN